MSLHRALQLLLPLLVAGCLLLPALAQGSPAVDPNRGPSEFNHHIAGYALSAVGLFVLASLASPRLRTLQLVWPFLFLLAGLFLAAWSDAEIWPRGNLGWTWLLHHDQEARQHKIYALLLIALGVVEYLRARGSLGRFWRAWSFPALAVLGAGLLLIHDHTGSSGARAPEARAYLVNPALDPDGKPWPVDPPTTATDPPAIDHSKMNMDHSSMAMDPAMPMDHAAPPAADPPGAASTATPHHAHHMTPSMLLVEREHFWFMIVGLAIALFKFLSDAGLGPKRLLPYLWPSATVLLGVLLTLYHE